MGSAWIYIGLAAIFEIAFALGLKSSEGFTKLVPGAISVVGLVISIWFLALAMRDMPAGVAYAAWTGLGATGTVIVAALFLGEWINPGTVAGIALILAGIIVIRLTTSA